MQRITKSIAFVLRLVRAGKEVVTPVTRSELGHWLADSSGRQLAPHVQFALGTFHNTPPHFEKEGLHSSQTKSGGHNRHYSGMIVQFIVWIHIQFFLEWNLQIQRWHCLDPQRIHRWNWSTAQYIHSKCQIDQLTPTREPSSSSLPVYHGVHRRNCVSQFIYKGK